MRYRFQSENRYFIFLSLSLSSIHSPHTHTHPKKNLPPHPPHFINTLVCRRPTILGLRRIYASIVDDAEASLACSLSPAIAW